jgi:nitrite reductase/ring-hydroxylating ferredoxin subunit
MPEAESPRRTRAWPGDGTGWGRRRARSQWRDAGAWRACPLLIMRNGGKILAFDNRSPHLAFSLHRGSFDDDILTCHWYHARFDIASGGAFDL